jgi:glycosyl transferase family 2
VSGNVAISVLVSVAPETQDLMALHGALLAELDRLGLTHEVIYLVGVAPARTVEQAQGFAERDPNRVKLLRFAAAVGRAGMLNAGVERSRGEVLITLPGRFEVDLAAIGKLYAAVREGTDMAFASRERGGSGVSARVQSELFNKLVSVASGRRFKDIASETRAFSRQVAEETPMYGDFYRYLPLLAERLGFSVAEIPAPQHPEAHAPVVHAPHLYLWRAIDVLSIFFISRFTRHPLRLFGGIGSVFFALGLGILAVAVIQRFTGTPLADRPVLVLGTLLVGLGVQTFTIGLLGELILFFHARSQRDYRIGAVYEGSGETPRREAS